MAKLTLNDLASLANETSAINTINNNNSAVETAMENTLSRDGTTPNTMGADIDMDSNDLLNVGTINATTVNVNGTSVLALNAALNPRGAWTTSTDYVVQDLVTNGGATYICAETHTSGTFSTDLAANKWQALTVNYDPSDVSITGGSITGITDLTIGDGGTGASTASGARSNLGLGTAAVENVGVLSGNVVQLDGSARLPAVDGSQLTNLSTTSLDQYARDMAMTAFIKADDTAGLQGPIFGSAFTSDDLNVSTNAIYNSTGDYYTNNKTLQTLSSDAFGASVTGSNATNASDGDDGTYADATTIPNWSTETNINNRIIWQASLSGSISISEMVVRLAEGVATADGVFLVYSSDGGTNWSTYGSEITAGDLTSTPTDFTRTVAVTANTIGIAGKQANYGGGGNDFRIHEFEVFGGTPLNMTLQPSATILDSANPNDTSLYVVVTEVGAADASTNMKSRMSIDNGVTWTTAAVADSVMSFSTDKLVVFDADVSAQTGSSLIWEITTENNDEFYIKEVRGVSYA